MLITLPTMPQTSSLFLLFQGVGVDISWETVVPEKRQKTAMGWQYAQKKPRGTDWICMGTYKWTPRNVHGSWGSLSEAEVLHDQIGMRQNYYHC